MVVQKSRQNKTKKDITLASWNVRTLLDSDTRPERRTAIIAHKLARYKVDICALSETHLPDQSSLTEVGSGYTFFWIGKPADSRRESGVGFAIRTSIVSDLTLQPEGISDRLMLLRLPISATQHATIISGYAPTMTNPDDVKDKFYHDIDSVINRTPHTDKLIIMGDFNARVGRDWSSWNKVLGHHGVGRENSNGMLLLSLCAEHQLAITNTFFQLPTKYKTTWMHPRSGHWHLIDYVIVRQRDIQDVRITRVMRGADCWSDHRLVRSRVSLSIHRPKRTQRCKPIRRINTGPLQLPSTQDELALQMDKALSEPHPTVDSQDVETAWSDLRDVAHNTAADVLGFVKRKHQDWFDENDAAISELLDDMHKAHHTWLQDKGSTSKATAYRKAKQLVQAKTRAMKDKFWATKAHELQQAADMKDTKRFYDGLKTVFGPKTSGVTPLCSADGQTLLTGSSEILQRWAEHFNNLLNQPSQVDEDAINKFPQWPLQEELSTPPSLDETKKALKHMANGKAPGPDGIPAEIYKYGGQRLIRRLVHLFSIIWEKQSVPQEFKDASIVHLYKRKGNRANCDNHRGISLLATAGKILSKIIATRLSNSVAEKFLPETQCGFRPGRSTVDMIFTARQLQEKCREQQKNLYLVFIDLTKAFDTVCRDSLWALLR